ncbi:MAG: hypothetical protein WBD13_17675 [Burkholderiaceae bacterium]
MCEIVRVGVDLAKRVIQVHAVDAAGKIVTSRAHSSLEKCSGVPLWVSKP